MNCAGNASKSLLCLLLSCFLGESSHSQSYVLSPPKFLLGTMYSDRGAYVDVNKDTSIDLVVPNFLMGLFSITIDEDGNKLGSNFNYSNPTATYPTNVVPSVINIAAAHFDSDTYKDIVALTNDHVLHIVQNLGGNSVDSFNFAPAIAIDNFSANFLQGSLTILNDFPILQTLDINNDQLSDIYLAGSQTNVWTATTTPGVFYLYINQGNNNFQRHDLALPGNVIDIEFADLNYDGTKETFLILTETGGQLAFSYEIHFAQFSNGALTFTRTSQLVGSPKVTSFEFIDVNGDGYRDYVFSINSVLNVNLQGSILFHDGDSQGNIQVNSVGYLPLPQNQTGLGDHICSLSAADLDNDGTEELLVLRGYSISGSGGLGATVATANSDLFIYSGPLFTNPTTVAMPARYYPTWLSYGTFGYMGRPLRSTPNKIQIVDLGGDQVPDIVIHGMSRTVNGSGENGAVTIKNSFGPFVAPVSGIQKIGDPSGTNLPPARLGFDGGPAEIGNSQFGLTVQNLPAGSIAGVMWGSYALPNIFPIHGIQIHVVPENFSNLRTIGGYGETRGFEFFPLPIPNHSSLRGFVGNFQLNYFHAPTNRLGSTQGSGLTVK